MQNLNKKSKKIKLITPNTLKLQLLKEQLIKLLLICVIMNALKLPIESTRKDFGKFLGQSFKFIIKVSIFGVT